MTQTTATGTAPDTSATRDLAERYSAAWNSNELESILELHAEGSTFHLHVEGFEEAVGDEAVRQQFALFLDNWKDLHFETVRLDVAEDLWVSEYRVSGTLETKVESGGFRFESVGKRFEVDGMDVLRSRDGLVVRKDTYLDSAGLQRQVDATTD